MLVSITAPASKKPLMTFWLENNHLKYAGNYLEFSTTAKRIASGVPCYSRKQMVFPYEGERYMSALADYLYTLGYNVSLKDHLNLEQVEQITL